MTERALGSDAASVPKRALLLSLLSLWVPVASSAVFPDWTSNDVGILVWLLALVPGFLLSYYRGWRGASIALAGGMAAFSVAQAVIVVTDASLPSTQVLLVIVTVLTAVSLGSGLLSAVFRHSLDRAERMALTDSGTGIPNRRHAILELEKAFAAAERGSELSVVLFDLDHFKRVNDEYGHVEGDRVLVKFAEVLLEMGRAMNVAARFGGEEFIGILRSTDAEGARIFADRVRLQVKQLNLRSGPLTLSAGVAEYEEGMASPDVLLAAADQALYRAKNSGRDRVVVLGKQGRRPDEEMPPLPEHDDESVPEGRGELVLVVDDDVDALRSVSRSLRRFGYTVLETPSPVRAVEIAQGLDDPLELVLTDIVMPEMGGFSLVEILQEVQEEIRVIYMSGYSQDDVDWGGVPGAARDYLTKPISIYTLARRVRRVLDQPVSTRKIRSTGESVSASAEGVLQESADPGAEPSVGGAIPPSSDGGEPESVGSALQGRDSTAGGPAGGRGPSPGARPPAGESPSRSAAREPPAERAATADGASDALSGSGADEGRDVEGRILVLHPNERRGQAISGLLREKEVGSAQVTAELPTVIDRLPHLNADLLVVDLGLPPQELADLLGVLAKREATAPAVLLLVDGHEQPLRERYLDLPISDFLAKPFSEREMVTRAGNLLRLRAFERRSGTMDERIRSRIAARTAELEEAREEVLRRLAWAAEFRDDVTGHHAERVGMLAGLVARELKWPPSKRNVIEKAAPLHDLGKIAIPDSILKKPGGLTPSETDVMQSHTTIGAELLSGSRNPILRAAEEIALTHHEWWDGSGYPKGLAGEEIPEVGRIVAIADAWDSLTNHRPYRDGVGTDAALEVIRQGAGTQFDPRVVEAFIQVLETHDLREALNLEVVARPDER